MLPDSFSVLAKDETPQNVYDANADLRTTDQRLDSLERAIDDWELSKPAISRLTELESDLSFIIEQIEKIDNSPTFDSLNEHVEKQNGFANASPELAYLQNDEKLISDMPVLIERNNEKFSESRGSEIADNKVNKFSSLSAAPLLNNTKDQLAGSQNVEIQAADSLSKFKGLTDIDNYQVKQNCRVSSITIGNGYAIHLASFKNRSLAVKTLKKFYAENDQLVCGKLPVIKDVEVNNQLFFSLRLGPFSERADAESSCSQVKQKQNYCGITKFEGQEMPL